MNYSGQINMSFFKQIEIYLNCFYFIFFFRECKASGIYIKSPEIPDVGSVRIRWPIAPMHYEGNPLYKELTAVRDVLMDMQGRAKYLLKEPSFAPENN